MLRPALLPDAAVRAASPQLPGESPGDWDERLRKSMTSVAWSERHDQKVCDQPDALGWDGQTLVFGADKHWIAGAPAGRAWLMGWWRLGTWRPLGEYDPKPSDLAISARDQGDPTKGGSGHVERVEDMDALAPGGLVAMEAAPPEIRTVTINRANADVSQHARQSAWLARGLQRADFGC